MLDFNQILTIVRGAADAASTLDQLVNVVSGSFDAGDQATLKAAYAEARRASDAAHDDLQHKLGDAAQR